MSPKGILRNKEGKQLAAEAHEDEFDRQQVIRNTRFNAGLVADENRGEEIRAKIAEAKNKDTEEASIAAEHLKWDELNLYKTEQEKAATMKIDEPKTPYEGGFDPEGEYYRDDGEDNENGPGEIPEFSLGEGEFETHDFQHRSMNGGEVITRSDDEYDDAEVDAHAPVLSAEEQHKKFEDMRKAHYRNAANPLKHKIYIPDVDDI